MQRKKRSKRIEKNIKMVIEFKLTVVHFARPKPMQICACAWIYRWTKKTVENQDWAAGPLGLRGAGPWAAGLLLAKPTVGDTKKAVIPTPGLFHRAQLRGCFV